MHTHLDKAAGFLAVSAVQIFSFGLDQFSIAIAINHGFDLEWFDKIETCYARFGVSEFARRCNSNNHQCHFAKVASFLFRRYPPGKIIPFVKAHNFGMTAGKNASVKLRSPWIGRHVKNFCSSHKSTAMFWLQFGSFCYVLHPQRYVFGLLADVHAMYRCRTHPRKCCSISSYRQWRRVTVNDGELPSTRSLRSFSALQLK